MGGGSVRGFIFFRVFKPNHRLIWAGLLSIMLGIAGHPYYVAYREHKAVEALSWSVASKVIVVDPGHGGPDPGCVGESGVLEKDVNLTVARRLGTYLSQAGATVILTRDGDYDLSDPEHQSSAIVRKRDDLEARMDLIKQYRADLFISIHANSIPSPRWWGAQTFYHPKDLEGKRLASLIQEELLKNLGQSYRWVRSEDFFVLRNAGVPAVMVEIGFLSNPREERLMSQPAHQGKIAWCIYAGVVRYFSGEPAPKCPF